jgi:hypothetical protein
MHTTHRLSTPTLVKPEDLPAAAKATKMLIDTVWKWAERRKTPVQRVQVVFLRRTAGTKYAILVDEEVATTERTEDGERYSYRSPHDPPRLDRFTLHVPTTICDWDTWSCRITAVRTGHAQYSVAMEVHDAWQYHGVLLRLGQQFLSSAEHSLDSGHYSPFVENLFHAVESSAKAILVDVSPYEDLNAILTSRKHSFVA